MDWTSQGWLWIVFAAALAWLFLRGGHGRNGSRMAHHGAHAGDHGPTAADIGAAIDPVSDEAVKVADAVTTLYEGRVYYFASRENRDRFEAAPADYASTAKGFPVQPPPASTHRRGGCC